MAWRGGWLARRIGVAAACVWRQMKRLLINNILPLGGGVTYYGNKLSNGGVAAAVAGVAALAASYPWLAAMCGRRNINV